VFGLNESASVIVLCAVQNANVVKITDFGLAKLLDSNEDVFKAAGGKVSLCILGIFVTSYLTVPYLRGRMPAWQTPSAEATARAQCASLTHLKVDRTSLKLWQSSGGDL